MKDLTFLGIGGALNTQMGNNCAFYKEGNDIFVIDPSTEGVNKIINKKVINEDTKNVVICITHTHSDHISGLGSLIWQCKIIYKIIPTIISNSTTFKDKLQTLLELTGVDNKYYSFSENNKLNFHDLLIEMQPTTHTPELECFGIMMTDNDGKYFYSGDTNDFAKIKELSIDPEVKSIYAEVSTYPKSHLVYSDLKTLENLDKITLMHFQSLKLYNEIKKENLFQMPKGLVTSEEKTSSTDENSL